MKFASHPSVCSECGWPYKSTTLKCNVRKVHSCTLSWRNTPSEGFSTSPVQRLMGQRTHTLLPTAEKLLQPNSNLKTTARSLAARKILQCKAVLQYFIPLKVGEAIRMKLPGEQKWSFGCCSCLLDRRSYEVQVDGRCFRRNHPQLCSTLKPSSVPSSNNEEPHQPEDEPSCLMAPQSPQTET